MIMATILDEILIHKKKEVELARQERPLKQLETQLNNQPRGFIKAIKNQIQQNKPAIIAEIKKASPSKGLICTDFNPITIATTYEKAGATCLSVLTDEKFFQGNNKYLTQIRKHCSLPLLRKDFIIDPYQIFEASFIGADCILLIVAALTDEQLATLYEVAIELNLDVLVEVHNTKELQRALTLNPPLLGINNRNLKTFKTSLDVTLNLLDQIPKSTIIVTESGIHTREDVTLMRKHGVHTFLVGESLMRADDPGAKLKELFY